MSSINCNKEMVNYHANEVTLPKTEQDEMRNRRDNGRIRLENGLKREHYPLPVEFSSQGSYAMRTMVQDNQCDYDIDDGIYFEKDDLKDNKGNCLTPYEARKRVRNALNDDRLAYDAVIKTNCVRQAYPDGYHIDIPVYLVIRTKDSWGKEIVEYEHASGDEWVKSDARKVTTWYNNAIGEELKSGETDYSQIRRVTKLSKKMARSRIAWKSKTTSGICLSRLVIDHFVSMPNRDDNAVYETWKAIKAQLDISLQIEHPVFDGKLLATNNDSGVEFFRDRLAEALESLKVLNEDGCTREQARSAWDKVFNTTYFSKQPLNDTDDGKTSKSAFVITSNDVADRQDGGRRFG